MNNRIQDIVIVGGGTAGWITAGVLAARYQGLPADYDLSITLVESPNIPTIGVGEGTWPTMRSTLKSMGVSETDFIRECDATFKQGAKFCKWTDGSKDDAYYHPLVLPEAYFDTNLANQWLAGDRQVPFAEAVSTQADICEEGLAPKAITHTEYDGVLNYAYHLDAGKFSEFIRKHCTQTLGVKHVLADVERVNQNDSGDVVSVSTAQEGEIKGDLFVDCTGFKSLLLGEALQVPFRACNDVLFVDTALAIRAPYAEGKEQIASHTISTAQMAGWIWDIGLSTRRGIGYVYSSDHCSDAAAQECLRQYLVGNDLKVDDLDIRKIPIKSGHREQFWKNNVVAIGLSAGFLEPLEASAIVLIEMSARMLSDQLPTTRSAMDVVAKRFNKTFLYRWDRIIDFLKLHYCLTKRTDSEFWIDNANRKTIPDSLQELLELWKHQAPWQQDFDHRDEVFPSASYQYVLYGMGFETANSFYGKAEKEVVMAEKYFALNKRKIASFRTALPKNRELIDKIVKYGLQTV